MAAAKPSFNVLIVGQSGRLGAEAALFTASLRRSDPDFAGRIIVAEPQPGPTWKEDPRMAEETLAVFERLKVEVVPMNSQHFGTGYPYGNKIEALKLLPKGEPFVFFDSDTLITGELSSVPFDFERPSASGRVTGTWPKPTLYGPEIGQIWGGLYDRFGLDFESTWDLDHPASHWRRYLYFNAGWFYYKCPHEFGDRFLQYALSIRDDLPKELIGQSLNPWLDQIALPLVIHSFGGGRSILPEGLLDGAISCHYRALPLMYAREDDNVIALLEELASPNWLKKALKLHEPFKKLVFQRKGERVRALFDQNDLPPTEGAIRQRIKKEGLWMR